MLESARKEEKDKKDKVKKEAARERKKAMDLKTKKER